MAGTSSSSSLLATVASEGERHLPALDPETHNHYRHMTAYHFVLPRLRGIEVLDYGCGAGYGVNFLWRRGGLRSVAGVDCGEAAVSYCRASYPDLAASFQRIDAGAVPFGDRAHPR